MNSFQLTLFAIFMTACGDSTFTGNSEIHRQPLPGQAEEQEPVLGTTSNSSQETTTSEATGGNNFEDFFDGIDTGGQEDVAVELPSIWDGQLQNPSIEFDENDLTDCKTTLAHTDARLVTSNVVSGAPDSSIEYEISLRDCNSNLMPIEGQALLFDLDVLVDNIVDFGYALRVGSDYIKGDLQTVEGTDLFGKAGPNYFHSRTDKRFRYGKHKAYLTIFLRGQTFSVSQAASYLRFGASQPVRQMVPVR